VVENEFRAGMTDKQRKLVRLFPMPSRFAQEYRGGSDGHVCIHALGELDAGGNLRREPSGYFSWTTPDIDGKLSILCPACWSVLDEDEDKFVVVKEIYGRTVELPGGKDTSVLIDESALFKDLMKK
jgi:hypothetical protein